MALALIVSAVLLLLLIRGFQQPWLHLLALMLALEIQPGELYPPLAILHIERVIILALLLSFFSKGRKLRFPPILKKFLYFYAVMVASIPLSFWVANSFQACVAFFEKVICCVMATALLDTEERIRKMLLLLVGLAAWLGGSAVYEYHAGVRQFAMGIERAEGLTSSGGDPNTLGVTMVVTMPLAFLFVGKENSKLVRLFTVLCITVYIFAIVTTGSRTAFVTLILMVLIFLVQQKKNLKYLPLIVIAAPLFWMVVPQQYKARYATVKTSVEHTEEDESYNNRILSWQGGVRMFLHNPLTGVGPDNYTYANGMRYWPGTPRHWLNAHSLYFKLLGELGLAGVFTFGYYLFSLIRLNYSLTKRFVRERASPLLQNYPRACNMSLYLLLFAGYSGHNLYRLTWFLLGAISGAVSLLETGEAKESATELVREKSLPWLPQPVPATLAESMPVASREGRPAWQ